MHGKIIIIPTLTLALLAWTTAARAETSLSRTVLAAAEEAFAAGDHGKVIRLGEPALEGSPEKADAVRLHYLLGRSIYEQTAADIRACREQGTLAKSSLKDSQAESMKSALFHFRKVYELDPENLLAPESMYMAGRILDYGCLNHFEEAIEQYDACYNKFPETQFGQMARDRNDILKPFKGGRAHGAFIRHP